MKNVHTSKRYFQGYTLLEMLVVITILSLVVPVLFASIQNLYHTHARTLSRALAVVDTTKGIQEVVRDIRAAVYAENGALPLAAIATSSITLYADTDYDGVVERIRYFLDGETVRKGIIEPTSSSTYPTSSETFHTVLERVVNANTAIPLFRFYTATSSEITSSAQTLEVRRITVEFIGSSRFGSESSEVTLRSSASIRNLKETY